MSLQSENINELAVALVKAQGEIKPVVKDGENPHFRSNYASIDNVIEATKGTLAKHGLCVLQQIQNESDGVILVTTLLHVSGQWMRSFMPIKPEKATAQGIGACISYMRRYSLTALLNISMQDDDDGNHAEEQGEMKISSSKSTVIAKPAPYTVAVQQAKIPGDLITDKQVKFLLYQIGGDQKYLRNILDANRVNRLEELSRSQAKEVIDAAKKYNENKNQQEEMPDHLSF